MQWEQIKATFGTELNTHSEFNDNTLWEDLRKRVIEHNIRVIAKYYTRITRKRLAELLLLSEDEADRFVSEQVISHVIYARINRPEGVVSFQKPQDPTTLLNDWSDQVNKLLNLVESNTQTISKILSGVSK